MLPDSQFALLGFGKYAPWIDLVNSLEHNGLGHTTDHLSDGAWLGGFLRRWNLNLPAVAVPAAPLRGLREFLHRCAEHVALHGTLGPREVGELNATMNMPARRALAQHQNGFAIEDIPERADANWVYTQIAASFAEMLVDGRMERVRFCGDERCRWIFLDETKGRTRRWCNERTCGNRNRVRRARAKKHPNR
jgi:predicted RNA-binding Zn ribbon-like protein